MKLYDTEIRDFSTPYVIAEIGANHNGSEELARAHIDAAKRAGANCVKFQSWTAETIFSKAVYDDNPGLHDQVVGYSFSPEQLTAMRDYSLELGIDFASTPFSYSEVDFLVDELDVGFLKIASMDLNNYPYLDYVARKGKPMVLSTGLSTLGEIDAAVRTIEQAGNTDLCILHCVANYPPTDANVNLRNMGLLRRTFGYPVGFSDHTQGTAVTLAAVALGACVIEKHFTLDHDMDGWDHAISADEPEMTTIVEGGARIALALGSERRVLSETDAGMKVNFRRSIVAARPITAGQVIAREDIDFKRPGTGIEPGEWERVVGRKALNDVEADALLAPEDF